MIELKKLTYRQLKIAYVCVMLSPLLVFAGIYFIRPSTIHCHFDLATGEYVITTYRRLIFTSWGYEKRIPYSRQLYQRYNIGYNKPLLILSAVSGYPLFGRRRGPEVDCNVPHAMICNIMKRFSPPEKEVKILYKHCVDMYLNKTHSKEVRSYLKQQYDRYNEPNMQKMWKEIMADPTKPENGYKFFENSDDLVCFFRKYRADYPRQLSPEVMDLIQRNYPDLFFMDEYLYNPSLENLFELGRSLCWQGKYSGRADMAFKKLDKAGKLDDFLKIIMPKDLPKLPGPSLPTIKNNVKFYPGGYNYYTHTFRDIPNRQAALHFLMHPLFIWNHINKKYKRNND